MKNPALMSKSQSKTEMHTLIGKLFGFQIFQQHHHLPCNASGTGGAFQPVIFWCNSSTSLSQLTNTLFSIQDSNGLNKFTNKGEVSIIYSNLSYDLTTNVSIDMLYTIYNTNISFLVYIFLYAYFFAKTNREKPLECQAFGWSTLHCLITSVKIARKTHQHTKTACYMHR